MGAVVCFQELAERTAPTPSAAERRARDLLEALPAAVYTTDADGRITFYNAAAAELLGGAPVPDDTRWCGAWKLYTPDGAPLAVEDCAMAVTLRENRPVRGAEVLAERPDGSRRPILPYPTPLRDRRGRLVGAVNMLVDVSEQKEAEARQRLLVDELNHRVKNTLATVQSLAFQTLRHTASPEAFRESFENRLVALARAHDLLTRRCWQGADVRDIVSRELDPWTDGAPERTRVEGPSVELTPRQAVALALVVHELTTNAVKHGALGAPDGAVSVTWRREAEDDDARVFMSWAERGGPAVRPPERGGFGSTLIRRSVAGDLGGKAELTWAPEGLACTLEFPLRG
nr:HWE histidine kinase domain-containing protein [Caulobacter sp. 17J80-11]